MKALERILHVEDEPDIQALVRLSLERIGGFKVLTCENGIVALDSIATFKPDLLLLDVMMPEMDGPTFLATLRTRPEFAGIPAIFLTAKAQPSDIEQLRNLGALAVLTKPIVLMEFAATLTQIWAGHAADSS